MCHIHLISDCMHVVGSDELCQSELDDMYMNYISSLTSVYNVSTFFPSFSLIAMYFIINRHNTNQ